MSKLGFYTKLSNNALAKDDTEVVNTKNTRDKRQNVKTANYNKSSQISESLLNAAVRAERTFRLQVIFDIASRCQKRFSEPTPEDIDEELHNLDELKGSNEDEVDLFSYAGRYAEIVSYSFLATSDFFEFLSHLMAIHELTCSHQFVLINLLGS